MPSKMKITQELERVVDVIKAHDGLKPQEAMWMAGVHLGAIGRKLEGWRAAHEDIQCDVTGRWFPRNKASVAQSRTVGKEPLKGYNLLGSIMRPGAMDFRDIPTRWF